jgi:lysophospholipase L1-like esterase
MRGLSKYLILLLITFGVNTIYGQVAEKQVSEHGTYWHQKASLFKLLPNARDEIIFLGNSITDGCEWAELFGDSNIKNRGISGDVTDGVLDRLDEIVESKPKMIFLMIGVNDLARGKSEEYIVTNIKKIVNNIRSASPKTRIYIESVLPVNPAFERFENHVNKTAEILNINKMLQDLARESEITYIDIHLLLADENNLLRPKYTNDGLHLTGAAYLVWKSAIEGYIK